MNYLLVHLVPIFSELQLNQWEHQIFIYFICPFLSKRLPAVTLYILAPNTGVHAILTLLILIQLCSHINVPCFTQPLNIQSNHHLKPQTWPLLEFSLGLLLTDTIDCNYMNLCNKLTPFAWKISKTVG